MAKRLNAGIVHKQVSDVIHDHDDRIEELTERLEKLEKAVRALIADAKKAPAKAPAKTAAKTETPADA
jgi:prefoldin subunit 5